MSPFDDDVNSNAAQSDAAEGDDSSSVASPPSGEVSAAQGLLDGLNSPTPDGASRPLSDQADDYEQIHDKLRTALDERSE